MGFLLCFFPFFPQTIILFLSRFPTAKHRIIHTENRFFFSSQANSVTQILLMFPFLPCLSGFSVPRWKEAVGCCWQPGRVGEAGARAVRGAGWAASPATHRATNTGNPARETLRNLPRNHKHRAGQREILHPQHAPTWDSRGMVCLDTSAACCGFCAVELLGSHVEWLSGREKSLALAHLGTKMTEDPTLWAVYNVFVKTPPYIFIKVELISQSFTQPWTPLSAFLLCPIFLDSC